MKVSVIIPVYNTEKFVEQAILSALEQEETAEIIVVDDGSSDNSYFICKNLAEKYNKIRLFRHSDLGNHGPSATRNLGMQYIQFDYFTFLDADDFYLPNRFKMTKLVFKSRTKISGVYEAFDTIFENEEKRKEFLEELKGKAFRTMEASIPPEKLFYENLLGKKGDFFLEGLTLKKEVIKKVGIFDEALRMGEDTDFIWRMCSNFDLLPGNIDKAVGIRRIHRNNSIFEIEKVLKYRRLLFKKWVDKIPSSNWPGKVNRHLFRLYITYPPLIFKQNNKMIRVILKVIYSIWTLLKRPKLFFLLIKP